LLRIRDRRDGRPWSALDCRPGRRILGDVSTLLEAANVADREIAGLDAVPLADWPVKPGVVSGAGVR
jgi:hypothetical protein